MSRNRPKPDGRSDNVEKLQQMVHNTIENMEEAEETMQFVDEEEKAQIERKNKRRSESIEGMRAEIKDESAAQNNE